MDKFIGAAESAFGEAAPATMLNPGIRDAYEAGLETFDKTDGVALVAKSSTAVDAVATQARAHVWTTDIDAFASNPELSEEVFGPTTLVVKCKAKNWYKLGKLTWVMPYLDEWQGLMLVMRLPDRPVLPE